MYCFDREIFDCARFLLPDGKKVSIQHIADKNKVNVETLKDQFAAAILNGTMVFEGKDEDNYPVIKMR